MRGVHCRIIRSAPYPTTHLTPPSAGVHEGRSPALLDNLFQAIFAAPIFVLMEVLMKLGFLLEFKGKVASHVEQAIAKFKASKGKKAN